MSVMPVAPSSHAPSSHTPMFGPKLGSLWRDLLSAWRGMLDSPLCAWARPQQAVRIYLPDNTQALSINLRASLGVDERRTLAAGFEAVVLPENLLLRRTCDLPKLPGSQLVSALHLEVQAFNPFLLTDVIWAYEIAPPQGTGVRAGVVLTSRKLIAQHVASVHRQYESRAPEVWVARDHGPGYVMLPGFGEARRQRRGALWAWVSAALVALTLGLMTAIAVTPSVQLYLRFRQANQAMLALQSEAAPAIAQRESLVRASEQLASLSALTSGSIQPLQTLSLVTQALPEDTYLLSLQIQGPKVNLTGQTANAAALMQQLGSTAGLRDVKAPTAATKPLGAPRESFAIEFTLDATKTRPAQ